MKKGMLALSISPQIARWSLFISLGLLLSILPPFVVPGLSSRPIQQINQPDLTVTDIWKEPTVICYQVLNQGNADSTAGFSTQAQRDGAVFAIDLVEMLLKPAERLERCFNATYACSGVDDSIQVCVDSQNSVPESDENNNCRQETWQCDQTSPQIFKGPQALEITETSTSIYWETDEPADTTVEYSLKAGAYESVAINQQPVQVHKIYLGNLQPGRIYQYRVSSRDATGNQSTSVPTYFQTLPLNDQKPPTVFGPIIQRRSSEWVAYEIEAPVIDNLIVGRVELYLDKMLTGVNYSAKPGTSSYMFTLAPGALGLTHLDFFNNPHTLEIRAFDAAGNPTSFYPPWLPDVEPMDGELDILTPPSDFIIYTAESATDYYEVPIRVYAAENNAELCLPPGIGGDLSCVYATQAVKKVEFYINGDLKHTSLPTDPGQTLHDYTWNASWLPLGDYLLRVIAYADDDATLSTTRLIRIRQGEAHLDVERQVSQANTWFDVRLTLRNTGTLEIILFDLYDHLTGFQVLPSSTENYTVSATFNHWLDQAQVNIEFHKPPYHSYRLFPGESFTVSYRAFPVLRPPSHWRTYSIGTEPLQVSNRVDYVDTRSSFDRPATITADGVPIEAAVTQAQASADYLIVTNPEKLYEHDASVANVDRLLSSLAELAEAKQGILGYLEGSPNAQVVDDQVEGWGASMRGSDGVPDNFLTNGYLLLIGENEIVPAGSITISHWWYDDFTVNLSDVYYADTVSNVIDPELRVGRMIGNNAWELTLPLQTILNVYRHTPGYSYERANALAVSGFPETRGGGASYSNFAGVRQDVVYQLDRQGVAADQLHTPDYSTAAEAALAFLARLPGMDIIHLAGHGSSSSLDDFNVFTFDGIPDPFGDANPIIFASSCNTGIYNRGIHGVSFAEKFLQLGAGVYLGATAVSYSDTNRAAANAIYFRLTPGRSFGSVLNEVKTGFGSGSLSGYGEDVWSAEYQLFGDPEYGADLGDIGLGDTDLTHKTVDKENRIASIDFNASPTVIQSTVPAYQITHQADGTDWVEIPAGGWVMEVGKPVVPNYILQNNIPADYVVQDVRLLQRSGESLVNDINLPMATFVVDGTTSQRPLKTWPTENEWWPGSDFEWSVTRNLDGSSNLSIVLYPFIYNSLTQQARFYQDYKFEIYTTPAGPRLVDLALDQLTVAPGKTATINLQLNHSDQAVDTFLELKISKPGNPETITGLPFYELDGLAGNALVSLEWKVGNLLSGDYILTAELRNLSGALYDTHQVNFRVGTSIGTIEGLTIAPQIFTPGQAIKIAYNFRNTGTENLDGMAVIEIQDLQNGTESRFEMAFSGLAPSQVFPVEWIWQSNPANQGKFRVIAYVNYPPDTTPVEQVVIRPYRWIYMPLVFR